MNCEAMAWFQVNMTNEGLACHRLIVSKEQDMELFHDTNTVES